MLPCALRALPRYYSKCSQRAQIRRTRRFDRRLFNRRSTIIQETAPARTTRTERGEAAVAGALTLELVVTPPSAFRKTLRLPKSGRIEPRVKTPNHEPTLMAALGGKRTLPHRLRARSLIEDRLPLSGTSHPNRRRVGGPLELWSSDAVGQHNNCR